MRFGCFMFVCFVCMVSQRNRALLLFGFFSLDNPAVGVKTECEMWQLVLFGVKVRQTQVCLRSNMRAEVSRQPQLLFTSIGLSSEWLGRVALGMQWGVSKPHPRTLRTERVGLTPLLEKTVWAVRLSGSP